MRYSIHSILRSAALLLLVGVVFLGCNEITTAPTPDLSLAEVEGSEASAWPLLPTSIDKTKLKHGLGHIF